MTIDNKITKLTEKLQKLKHYRLEKLISINILQVNNKEKNKLKLENFKT